MELRRPQNASAWRSRSRIPRPDLTGADGVNQAPDIIFRTRWEPKRGGHVQTAGLLRQIRGAPPDRMNDVVGGFGWGFTFTGRLPSPVWSERDNIMFQHNVGAGIGRYISDLSAEGGQDGVYDPEANEMRVLSAYSGYIGYEHWWTKTIRSAVSFGIVNVDNIDIQSDDALHLTRRYCRQRDLVADPATRHGGRVPLGGAHQQGRTQRPGQPDAGRRDLQVLAGGQGRCCRT